MVKSVRLEFADAAGTVVRSIPMSVCRGVLVSDDVIFPEGSFTYHLVGRDTGGNEFSYNTRNNVTFVSNIPFLSRFSVVETSSSEKTINLFKALNLTYIFLNSNLYASGFSLSTGEALPGLTKRVYPERVVVPGGGTATAVVQLAVTNENATTGTGRDITLTASNDCLTLTTGKQVLLVKQVNSVLHNECSDTYATFSDGKDQQ